MKDYLKLIRIPNLIFIIAVQAFIYFAVIMPIVGGYGFIVRIPYWVLASLVFATMLIAAGGYVINDYFDVKIDRMNRPESVIIANTIDKHDAMHIYMILTAAGVGIGVAAAVALKSFTIAFIYIIVAGLMWFYSSSYKRMLVVGNLMVALMSALVPMIPAFAAKVQMCKDFGEMFLQTPVVPTIYTMCCGLGLFAFIMMFIIEIVKDMRDEYGDREMECHTIPVVWGVQTAKIIVTSLAAILLGLSVWAALKVPFVNTSMSPLFHLNYSVVYVLTAILVPVVFMVYSVWNNSCKAYCNALHAARVALLFGATYPLFFYYLLSH